MISTQLIMDRTLAMMMVCSPVVSLALCLRYRGSNPLLCQKLYNCWVSPYDTPEGKWRYGNIHRSGITNHTRTRTDGSAL